MKKAKLLIVALAIILTLSACGAAGGAPKGADDGLFNKYLEAADGAMYAPQADYETVTAMAPSYDRGDGISIAGINSAYSPPNIDTRKLIRTASLEMETTEFNESLEAIEANIIDADGYIQNSNVYGSGYPDVYYSYGGRQSANLSIRIPANSLEGFLNSVSSCAAVIRSSINTDEVSEYYYDTEARLVSLKIQEQTLLDILKKADTLTDVITLQNALLEIRYQIESAEGTLRRLDNQVAYSTVNITLTEVKRITDTSDPIKLGDRISFAFSQSVTRFKDGFENFLVYLAGSGITIFIWLIVLAVIAIIVKVSVSRSTKKAAALNDKPYAYTMNVANADDSQKDQNNNT